MKRETEKPLDKRRSVDDLDGLYLGGIYDRRRSTRCRQRHLPPWGIPSSVLREGRRGLPLSTWMPSILNKVFKGEL